MLNGTPVKPTKRMLVLPAAASGIPTVEQSMMMMSAVWWLASVSPIHARWAVSEVRRLFWPPLKRQQFRMYVEIDQNGVQRVVGAITWAMMARDTRDKFFRQEIKLLDDDWDGGLMPVVVDMIAPFGHARTIIRDMRIKFAGQIVWAQRRNHQGILRPVMYRGYSRAFAQQLTGQADATNAA